MAYARPACVSVASLVPVTAVPIVSRGPPLPAPPEAPPPPTLTNGMPDPSTVQRQKEGYVRSLDEQLRLGAAALESQVKSQRDSVREQAESQKQVFAVQVDQQVRMQEMQVDHQFAAQVKELKKQAMRQRALLEQQALQLSFEYQDKKAEEDMQSHHYELQQESHVVNERLRSLPNVFAPLPTHPSLKPVVAASPAAVMVTAPMLTVNRLGSSTPMAPLSPLPSYAPAIVAPSSPMKTASAAYTSPPVTYTATSQNPSHIPSVLRQSVSTSALASTKTSVAAPANQYYVNPPAAASICTMSTGKAVYSNGASTPMSNGGLPPSAIVASQKFAAS